MVSGSTRSGKRKSTTKTTTRQIVKASLVSLSLAATLGGWALLARQGPPETPGTPEPVMQTLDLRPIPTLARPSVAGDLDARDGTLGSIPSPQPVPTLSAPTLRPIPVVSAPTPLPRPIVRTRSSR